MERNTGTCLFQTSVSVRKKPLSEKCEYANERFGKAHCLMLVHSGINKNLSNEAIFWYLWCINESNGESIFS